MARRKIAYLAGCDGGRSTVRRQAAIDFPGTPATRFSLLGDVELDDQDALPLGVSHGPGGRVLAIPRPGYLRIITADGRPPADQDAPVTLAVPQDAVDHAPPPSAAARRRTCWTATTPNATRPAPTCWPVRRPRSCSTLKPTACGRWSTCSPGSPPTRPATARSRRLSPASTTRYDMGERVDHPWLGRLTPNLTLITDAGPADLAAALTLAAGRPVLLDLAPPHPDHPQPHPDRRQSHPHAQPDAAIREAAIGQVREPAASP